MINCRLNFICCSSPFVIQLSCALLLPFGASFVSAFCRYFATLPQGSVLIMLLIFAASLSQRDFYSPCFDEKYLLSKLDFLPASMIQITFSWCISLRLVSKLLCGSFSKENVLPKIFSALLDQYF